MTELDRLLADNKAAARSHGAVDDARPARRLAVVTCMDARIDALGVLRLQLGDAHVIRNAGGRVTDDVLRSLAISSATFGVDTVVLIQHTGCGLEGTTDQELRERTGAPIEFHAIADHASALRRDVEQVAATPYLSGIASVHGLLLDLRTGVLEEVVSSTRG